MISGLNYSRPHRPLSSNAALINKVLGTPGSTIGLWLTDLWGLFVPRRCAGCDTTLMRFEECLCLYCLEELPRTRFHDDPSNRVEQLFRGKAQLAAASALLHFSASGMVQRILHRIKYNEDREAARFLGRLMAEDLKASKRFSDVDALLAVPLHPEKLRKRGYNQSQLLVDGMREAWPKDNPTHALVRMVHTASQTRRGRLDRWQNVKDAFDLRDAEALADKHVLLVDDVVTTGATIEGCAIALRQAPGVRISVFAAACA